MFIDTHFHLSSKDNSFEHLERAMNVAVTKFVASACDKESILESETFMNLEDQLFYSVGFHPEVVSSITEKDLLFLDDFIANHSKVVAVGEIGLDYYWDKEHKEEQRKLFRYQLSLAKKHHLPVVIHSREAIQETYDILKEYSLTGIIHCFSGSIEMANQFIELGYLLGVGGIVTFKNSHLQDVVKKTPLSSLVLETDSPYLAPDPYRGKTNSPEYIPLIASKIASLKEVTVEEVAEVTTNNARRIFDLPR